MDRRLLLFIILIVGIVISAPVSALIQTQLLITGNTTTADSSYSKHPVIVVGNTTVNTTYKYVGAGSVFFDGVGDYLDIPASSDFDFGTEDFAIIVHVRFDTMTIGTATVSTYYANRYDASNQIYFGVRRPTAGVDLFYLQGLTQKTGQTTVALNSTTNISYVPGTWYTDAFVRSNGVFYLVHDGTVVAQSSTASTCPTTNANATIGGFGALSTHYLHGELDDVLVYKGTVNTTYVPTSEIVTMVALGAGGDYSGGWGTAPHTVTLTSFSTGSPDSYNWTLGDGEYNNSAVEFQHTYLYPGIYNISLTVRNLLGFESTYPAPDPVVVYYNPAINYVQYSAEIEQYYPVSATVKDANTGELIPTSALYDEYGGSLTGTGTGSFTGSLSEGGHILTAVSSYYANATEAIAVTSGTNQYTIEMIATGSNPSVTTYFTPYTAKIKAVDESGVALPYAYFSVVYKGSSLPNTSTSWLTSMYGLSEETASELVDTETPMTGYAGTDGSLVFTLFKSLKYGITISNVTEGWSNYVDISPIEDEYTVICPRATTRNNTATPIKESRLPFYVINETASGQCYNLSMTYQDTSGDADGLKFQVWTRDRSTLLYEEDYGDPGTDLHVANYTFCGNRGDEVIWLYNQSMPR